MRAPVLFLLLVLVFPLAAEIPISQPDIVPLDANFYRATTPSVTAGDGFLVASALRYSFAYPGSVMIRTYDDDGTPRQTLPIMLRSGHTPHAFWNGSEYVVVQALPFSRFGSIVPLPAIITTRVQPDGTIIETAQTNVAMARYSAAVFDVAFDGVHALAGVSYDGMQHLLRLDRNGNLLEDTPLDSAVTAIAVRPGGDFFVVRAEQGDAVAAGGNRFAILDDTPDGVTAIVVDAAGQELDRFTVSTAGITNSSITWDGSAWIAAYSEYGTLCTTRFTSGAESFKTCGENEQVSDAAIERGVERVFKAWIANGQVMTDSGLASTRVERAFEADAIVDEHGLLVAWVDDSSSRRRLTIGGLTNDGKPRPEHGIDGTFVQSPALARAGNQTLLAWVDNRSVRAVILDETGAPRTPPLVLGEGYGPSIAVRGDEWLVTWDALGAIRSALITRTRDAVNEQDFSGAAYQESPEIAAIREGFLVVWRESESSVSRIVVEPLDAAGRRITGGVRLVEGVISVGYPTLGCSADACLVAWMGGSNELWTMLVRHDGTQLSEARVMATSANARPIVEPLHDGSFRVWSGREVTRISRLGDIGPTAQWHRDFTELGEVVTWRGRTTAVYVLGKDGRVYAHELGQRTRSARH